MRLASWYPLRPSHEGNCNVWDKFLVLPFDNLGRIRPGLTKSRMEKMPAGTTDAIEEMARVREEIVLTSEQPRQEQDKLRERGYDEENGN
jgi:hypothetical protein